MEKLAVRRGHLAVNAPVMLISNLRTEAGLVNGATGTVVDPRMVR